MITASLVLLSLATVCQVGPPMVGVAPAFPVPPAVCQPTALSLRFASNDEARADFWVAVAEILNDPECDRIACLNEAISDMNDAFDEAQEQFDARMDLCDDLGHEAYDPDIDPQDFSENVTNTFLPLTPNRTLVYEKQTSEGLERIEVTTLMQTVEVDGVTCRVVRDTAMLDGEVIEDTDDFYAQHSSGDVYYVGEVAKNYEDGFLDNLDGSWRHGREGAKAGVIMKATPLPGDKYRQEFAPGTAEDIGEVISLNQTVTVAAGTFNNCIETEDTSPLEPDAMERKFYAPGIGVVLEIDLETGERLELIQIIN